MSALKPGWASRIASLTIVIAAFLLAPAAASAQTFTILHSFTGQPDGNGPNGGLVLDASGNLYGTTRLGGVSYHGTAFKLSPSGNETVLYSFVAAYGASPNSTLVRGTKGTFYGTTNRGGAYDLGTVFKVDKKGHETVLHSFAGGADGAFPNALIRDSDGNLYGTASEGGGGSGCYYGAGCGLVFKLDPAEKMTVLYTFPGGADGGTPWAGLVRDSVGNLYGGTWSGGDMSCNPPYGCGTIFKLDASGNESVLYSFTATGGDGGMPVGIIRDQKGTIYGATQYGGGIANCGFGCGTVFKLAPSGKETVLYAFTNYPNDGAWPRARVVRDASGNIYGTTLFGGSSGGGTVFMLDPSGKETTLHSFTYGADGAMPTAGVVLDAAGNIYGTTSSGGDLSCGRGEGCGTLFKLTP